MLASGISNAYEILGRRQVPHRTRPSWPKSPVPQGFLRRRSTVLSPAPKEQVVGPSIIKICVVDARRVCKSGP
jgi:hypothetical protein